MIHRNINNQEAVMNLTSPQNVLSSYGDHKTVLGSEFQGLAKQ